MDRSTHDHRQRSLSLFGALALVAVSAGFTAGCEPVAESETLDAQDTTDAVIADIQQRLEALESREEMRTTLLAVSAVVDSSDPSLLPDLVPYLTDDFVLDAVDFDGVAHHFEGADGLVNDFGPIMKDAKANLMPSAIDVELDGDMAYATFKFANSVKPPPQLNLPVDVKVLLFAANTATFRREGGAWKLASFELLHSLAYPGSLSP